MKRKKGSILIFTLWVLIILSILSIIISYRATGSIRITKYESENIRALYLAKAGFMKMLEGLNKDTNAYDSLNEDWNSRKDKPKEFKFGGGIVFYGASDEEARLNLNSQALEKEYLIRMGIGDSVSQNILDYKAQKGEKGFEFMEELFLVDGMTAGIYSAVKDYVTIYRGNNPKVNINTASEKMLNIILGDDSVMVERILNYRKGNDGELGTMDDGIVTDENFSSVFEGFGITPDLVLTYQNLFSTNSNYFRIWAESYISEDRKAAKHIVGVAERTGKIYYWKED